MGERTIDLDNAKSQLPELIEQAARGDDVIITEGGEPVAMIVPIDHPNAPRRFGSAKGLIQMGRDFDDLLDDFREYM